MLKTVLRPVDLAHARVEHGQHIGGAAARAAGLGHCHQGADRDDRQVRAESEALRDAAGGAHASEGTGAFAEGQRIHVGQLEAMLGQQGLYHRQHGLRMRLRASRGAHGQLRVAQQRDRGEFGGGFDGEDDGHGAYFTAPGDGSMSVVRLEADAYAAVRGWIEDGEWIVACLCAGWCHVCEDWRAPFAQLAERLPGVRFLWVDVEDEADVVEGIEVEDFPTLLIQRGDAVIFLGAVRPNTQAVETLVRSMQGRGSPTAAQRGLRLRAAT